MKKVYLSLLVALLVATTSFSHIYLFAGSAGEKPLKSQDETVAEDFMLGVDANFALTLRNQGKEWSINGEKIDVLTAFHDYGVEWIRVRVWTKDTGESSLEYASEVATWAQNNGLKPYFVLFLSEDWADLGKQPAPTLWRNMSLQERADAIRDYSRRTALHFKDLGINSSLYEVGNEIDYGICGVFAEESTDRDNVTWMRENIWRDAATLIKACQDGVKEADLDAEFLLHITHWWDPNFCIAFYRAMMDFGVQVDYLGLSYYPSTGLGNTLEQFKIWITKLTETVGKPLIIPEFAYPSTSKISGMFSSWNKEVSGYPLNQQGQRDWLIDFLNLCYNCTDIAGVFYWSPEWYSWEGWQPFSLFSAEGEAKLALDAFRTFMEPTKAAIDYADAAIEKAEKEGRTVKLDQAKDLFEEAQTQFNAGNQEEAKMLARESESMASNAETPPFKFTWEYWILIIIAVILGAIIIKKISHKFLKTSTKDLTRMSS